MDDYRHLSKFISLILRHKPEVIGIKLDNFGWANVEDLIIGIKNSGKDINLDILTQIVLNDDKRRYSFNEDKTLIRANQGHSIQVDVNLDEKVPPNVLYHGTGQKSVSSIKHQGIMPMTRLYVHLSSDIDTAIKVGKRHGNPYVFTIDTKTMFNDGIKFYLSENGIWLTKYVDSKYLIDTNK